MHMKHFGDSYDIVKQSLLRWLQPFGDWSMHPMFTEALDGESEAFGGFLGVRVISTEVLKPDTDRSAYFSCARSCGNLFLDPITGLRIEETTRRKIANYLLGSDVALLMRERQNHLLLVFDQSLPNGKDEFRRQQLSKKLRALAEQHKVSAFAYLSHACFIIAGRENLLEEARKHLIAESRLPESRFLQVTRVPRAAGA